MEVRRVSDRMTRRRANGRLTSPPLRKGGQGGWHGVVCDAPNESSWRDPSDDSRQRAAGLIPVVSATAAELRFRSRSQKEYLQIRQIFAD